MERRSRPTGGHVERLVRAVSRSRLFAALVAVGVTLTTLLAPAAAVSAQDPLDCSRLVVDTSGSLDVVAMEEAIAAANPAVTIVIRGYDSVPGADLVGAVNDVVVSCFSDDQDGVRQDVIMLGLSIDDRLSDVLVGSGWGVAVPDPDLLRTEVMGTRFAEGQFTEGLLDAIEEIDRGVDRQLALEAEEGSAAPGDDSDPVREDTEDTEDTAAPAPSAGGDGQSPWAIGGGILGVAGCAGVFLLVSRHRRLASAREDLKRASAAPLARLGVLRERDGRLLGQSGVWSKTTAGKTLADLQGLIRQAETARASTDGAYGLYLQSIPEGIDAAGQDEVGRARVRVMEVSQALDVQDESLDRLAAFGAHLDHLLIALPTKIEILDEEIDATFELADQRASEGWAVEGQQGDLDRLGDSLDGIDFDRLELDLLTLSAQVESDEAEVFKTNHYLESLPNRVASLKEWNAGLEVAADLELRRIEDSRRQFALLAATHASDSWQWAADFPEQAMEELVAADEMQNVAISELISAQRFDDAGRQLDAAGLRLMAADHLLDQVDDLVVDLERALEEAPGIVTQCRSVLANLVEYVTRHQTDLDPELVGRPPTLEGAIVGLEQELRQVKPNFLRVAETGDRLNQEIDELLSEAEEQHLRMEALRRRLQREKARVRRSIDRARRSLGWELFKSTDGQALDNLERSAGQLPSDLAQAVDKLGTIADEALRIQERIIAKRRRTGLQVSTGRASVRSGRSGSSGRSSRRSRSSGSRGGRSFSGSSRGGRSFGGGRSSGSF